MKKLITLIFLIITAYVLAACGSESAHEAYKDVAYLNNAQAVHFDKSDKEPQKDGRKLVSEMPLNSSSDAFTVFLATEDLKVYSKADLNASVLGTIKAGADIKGLEMMSDNWGKISYNGRIAYIKSNVPLLFKNAKETETTSETTQAEDMDYVADYDEDYYNDDNTDNTTAATQPAPVINPTQSTDPVQPTTSDSDSSINTSETSDPGELEPVTDNTEPVTDNTEPGEPGGSEPVTDNNEPGGSEPVNNNGQDEG